MTLAPVIGGLAGGVGLFLLGMWLMTEGLKLAAGPALERILARSTGTRLRGLASGVLVTALVQSSSAVTVAAIGFVNAGLLTLNQALWVLFGANVGTTATGWLVAVVGLDLKIEAAALPLIGAGMLLHFTGQRRRRGAVGMTLAGFGTLFLGIDVLRTGFAGAGARLDLPDLGGALSVPAHILAGAALTVLMQSSSAALAVALTAAQGGLLPLTDAAAVVIGANVGTTVKALLAALGATPNAKRAAAAHVLFNLLTGGVALALLPWLVDGIVAGQDRIGMERAPAATLALFHTVFNVLGVLLVWPMTDRLAAFLRRRFRSAEEDEARPRYLDDNAAAVPALALSALEREVRRLGAIALRLARTVLADVPGSLAAVARDARVAARLSRAVGRFVVRLNAASMAPETARRLPLILRVARYYDTVAEVATELAHAGREPGPPAPAAPVAELRRFLDRVGTLLARVDPESGSDPDPSGEDLLAILERQYQALKAHLLEAGALGAIDMPAMEVLLRRASLTRRAAEQAVKAARALRRINATATRAAGEAPSPRTPPASAAHPA
jgi:phosphate:Na+ symporter